MNDVELQAMPSKCAGDLQNINYIQSHSISILVAKYCKRLYLDVTSTNQGKLTWNTIKPIIQGKILYTPPNADTESIVKFVRST